MENPILLPFENKVVVNALCCGSKGVQLAAHKSDMSVMISQEGG